MFKNSQTRQEEVVESLCQQFYKGFKDFETINLRDCLGEKQEHQFEYFGQRFVGRWDKVQTKDIFTRKGFSNLSTRDKLLIEITMRFGCSLLRKIFSNFVKNSSFLADERSQSISRESVNNDDKIRDLEIL
jgi:hypothetical protein